MLTSSSPDIVRRTVQLVLAATKQLGIGKNGELPWKLPGDMAYFKELTSTTLSPNKTNAVIMGRKTWESIPPKFRPLKGRVNVVLTRGADENSPPEVAARKGSVSFEGAEVSSSMDAAMTLLASPLFKDKVETVFVIGGGQLFKEVWNSPDCTVIHLTTVDANISCDTFVPPIDPSRYRLWSSAEPQLDAGMRYQFLCYTRVDQQQPTLPPAVKQHEELQYLKLVEDVIKSGVFREDRTGTGTYSKFGCQMRFDLRHTFPLLTTKRVFWRGVAEELLWFLRGDTNARHLQEKDIHIWDGNASREYLDSIGLAHREEGDLGPVYGFQWRHFGAQYTHMHADYTGQGIDQLANLIGRIKANPNDRRLVLTAWNPAALPEMALPPCHMFAQFYVANGELSCLMYQRSCDLGLGVPFNVASYALLTRLIAQACDLKPGEFVHMLGDTHVYANHVEPLKEQLRNVPRHFPVLHINPDKKDIDAFTFDDFRLEGYNPHRKIAMQMAV